jgi:dihydroflavonol-4-reductase
LLGSVSASFAELAREVVALSGGPRPPRPVPAFVLRVLGKLSELASYVTRRQPVVTPETAYMTSLRVACDCSKAERELGYRERTLTEMVSDTLTWMKNESGRSER